MGNSLLYLKFSPREASVSSALGDHFLSQWQTHNSAADVVTRHLGVTPLAGPTEEWITANMTPENERDASQQSLLADSDEIIEQILAADRILIATPMFNFSVPWHLKAFIDNIVRVNKTFSFDPEAGFGPLLNPSKKVKVIWTSAGTYEPGTPFHPFDVLTPYLQKIFGFMGVEDVSFASAGGMWSAPEDVDATIAGTRDKLSNEAIDW